MTEVVNYGGVHRTWLRDCLLCFGVPLLMYIKEGEEEASHRGARAIGESN